jgi:hypothetical protein
MEMTALRRGQPRAPRQQLSCRLLDAGKTTITSLFDTRVLDRIDADAKRIGITRAAWLHVAADERLEGRR